MVATAVGAERAVSGSARGQQPNVLFVFTDQQRADALGVADGYTKTPHIDALAARGTRYTRCFTPAPVCMPARFSLLTGQYPHQLGIARNGPLTLTPDAPSWVRRLREAGYRTAVIGKTHYFPQFGDLRTREPLLHGLGYDYVYEIAGARGSISSSSAMTDAWKEAGVYDALRADCAERKANCEWMVRPSPLGY